MSKDPIPLYAPDISQYARSLSRQLLTAGEPPSHLALLNMLAKSGGFRNYQHLRAAHAALGRMEAAQQDTIDYKLVERTMHQFDAAGRLIRWPARRPVQELGLWVLWSVLPSDRHLHERHVNAHLNAAHLFGDAPLIRRSLLGLDLLTRNQNGSDYMRLERRPPAEAREVIRRVAQRRSGREADE
tara:strand:- start:2418 stop:2972 length:555 start_codon:yes stop_codon:yes gene_type:complete